MTADTHGPDTPEPLRWSLEVVRLPVADVDRAKEFYAERLGFVVDHDVAPAPGVRIVQLTPRGSGCSIVIGEGMGAPPVEDGPVRGLQLVVADLSAAHVTLVERGVEVSEIQVVDGDTERLRLGGTHLDDVGFVFLTDPDGNAWGVQQISSRG